MVAINDNTVELFTIDSNNVDELECMFEQGIYIYLFLSMDMLEYQSMEEGYTRLIWRSNFSFSMIGRIIVGFYCEEKLLQ